MARAARRLGSAGEAGHPGEELVQPDDDAEDAERGEWLRLLYVGVTRAREHLLLLWPEAGKTASATRLARDLPDGWLERLEEILVFTEEYLERIHGLLDRNGIFIGRTRNVAKLSGSEIDSARDFHSEDPRADAALRAAESCSSASVRRSSCEPSAASSSGRIRCFRAAAVTDSMRDSSSFSRAGSRSSRERYCRSARDASPSCMSADARRSTTSFNAGS